MHCPCVGHRLPPPPSAHSGTGLPWEHAGPSPLKMLDDRPGYSPPGLSGSLGRRNQASGTEGTEAIHPLPPPGRRWAGTVPQEVLCHSRGGHSKLSGLFSHGSPSLHPLDLLGTHSRSLLWTGSSFSPSFSGCKTEKSTSKPPPTGDESIKLKWLGGSGQGQSSSEGSCLVSPHAVSGEDAAPGYSMGNCVSGPAPEPTQEDQGLWVTGLRATLGRTQGNPGHTVGHRTTTWGPQVKWPRATPLADPSLAHHTASTE